MNFLHFHASTDYILSVGITQYGETTSTRLYVLPSRGIVVEPSPIRSLAADFRLREHLGFNLMPSNEFFLFSPRSRLGLIYPYVVVSLALRVPSNSVSSLDNTSFSIVSKCKFPYILTVYLRAIIPPLK